MDIELLFIAECPSWRACHKQLRHALIDLDLEDNVKLSLVASKNDDVFERFQGSPTILVNGRDLFEIDDFDGDLACRVYETRDGLRGYPTVQEITERLASISKR